jgi:hypothetical protein
LSHPADVELIDNFKNPSWNSGVTDFSIGGTLFAQIQRTRETCGPERLQHKPKGQEGEVGRRKIGLTFTERSSGLGKGEKEG